MKYIITVGHLPYRELSPNARVHWAKKAKAAKVQREEVGWLVKALVTRPVMPLNHARVSYTFVIKRNRSIDIDNLVSAMKSAQDGLVDGGLIVKDDYAHLQLGYTVVELGKKDQTIIEVEEIT